MPLPIYFVGTAAEVEHHARPLIGDFDVRVEEAEAVERYAQPGEVCLFFNEFFQRFRFAIHELVRRQCPTLYAIDGILEWRNMWEFPAGDACLWTGRPILSHKIACIGPSQARLFESWGQSAQCEIVGVPRFDALLGRTRRLRSSADPFTILVLTAKWPGFNPEQWRLATQSLKDLKQWLEQNPQVGGQPVKSIWRITQGLESEVGVDNALRDTTGQDLATVLTQVDAVVTTASTAMLEGMLQQIPVALLDYNNCPHYVPAAWRITAQSHIEQVMPELLTPPPAKMLYQQHLLHDALECASPAQPRMVALITSMAEHARHELAEGRKLTFRAKMLRNVSDSLPAHPCAFHHDQLFPGHEWCMSDDLSRLRIEVTDLRNAFAAADRKGHDQEKVILALNQVMAEDRARRDKSLRRLPRKAARFVRDLVKTRLGASRASSDSLAPTSQAG